MPLHQRDFTWDGYFWSLEVALPFWRGFQSRRGPYGAQDSIEPSDGAVRIVFAPEGRDDKPLSDSEIALVAFVLEHMDAISRALLLSLLNEYPQQHYDYTDDEAEQYMPDVRSVEDFKRLIGLHSIHVHQVAKGGVPYAGFEFGCTWDDEHGLGVLMNGTRTVKIGGADTAILLWIARRDAERS